MLDLGLDEIGTSKVKKKRRIGLTGRLSEARPRCQANTLSQ